MGRPLFTITSGNSWIIQWTPVDYVVSKTLGPPLGEEDRKQKGIKTRLKVKELNRSGSYPLTESQKQRAVFLQAVCWRKLYHTAMSCRCGAQLQHQKMKTGLSPYCQGTEMAALVLLQQSRTHGFSPGDTNMFLGRNPCFPLGSSAPLTKQSEFLLQSHGVESQSPELSSGAHKKAELPHQPSSHLTCENKNRARPPSEANTKPPSQWKHQYPEYIISDGSPIPGLSFTVPWIVKFIVASEFMKTLCDAHVISGWLPDFSSASAWAK